MIIIGDSAAKKNRQAKCLAYADHQAAACILFGAIQEWCARGTRSNANSIYRNRLLHHQFSHHVGRNKSAADWCRYTNENMAALAHNCHLPTFCRMLEMLAAMPVKGHLPRWQFASSTALAINAGILCAKLAFDIM